MAKLRLPLPNCRPLCPNGEEMRTRARQIHDLLRERIVNCDYPPLHKLKIANLVAELGANSSAVREALSRLAAEHLVEARDQRGFRVAELSLEELDDLTRSRIDIETMMLRRSIEAGDDQWENRLRHATDAVTSFAGDRSTPDAIAIHNEFHEALLAACDSPSMMRMRASLFSLSQRYRSFAVHRVPEHHGKVDRDHQAIADATIARDVDRATAALAAHLASTGTNLRAAFIDQGGCPRC